MERQPAHTSAITPAKTAAVESAGADGVRALSWEAFASTYLPAMLLALGTGIALPAIPILAKSFDVSFGVASFVITSFLIGGLVGSLPTGWVIDRVGRRAVLVAGPLLTAVAAVLVMTARSFPELLVYRFLAGWAAQMWLLARLAGIAEGAGANQRGRQVSWMYGMDNVGLLSGPLVGGFIAHAWGPRSPFAAYALLALAALLPSLLLGQDSPQRKEAGTTGPVRAEAARRPSLAEIVLPRLAFFGVAFFSAIARGPIFAGMLHLYAAFAYNLNAATIGVLATSASAISLPIGFLAGYLMDRFGRKMTMVPGFLGVTVTMLLLAATAFLHLPLRWYIPAFLLAVLAQALTGSSVQTVGADVAPPNARGTFLGLWRFTAQVGTSLSPMAFALLADKAGYGYSFVFVSAAALAVGYLLIKHVPETSKARAA
jgi:MFS family permease